MKNTSIAIVLLATFVLTGCWSSDKEKSQKIEPSKSTDELSKSTNKPSTSPEKLDMAQYWKWPADAGAKRDLDSDFAACQKTVPKGKKELQRLGIMMACLVHKGWKPNNEAWAAAEKGQYRTN